MAREALPAAGTPTASTAAGWLGEAIGGLAPRTWRHGLLRDVSPAELQRLEACLAAQADFRDAARIDSAFANPSNAPWLSWSAIRRSSRLSSRTAAYEILLLPTALRALQDLPAPIRMRLAGEIDDLAQDACPPDAEALQAAVDFFRLCRHGQRMLYGATDGPGAVIVVDIRPDIRCA